MEKVVGDCRTIRATFTRPADTNAYTAGDVVCNSTSAPAVLTFAGAIKHLGSVLQQAMCINSANVATKPDLELWLFDTAPAAVNDNAAFAPTDAELLRLVGVVSFPTADFKVGLSTASTGNSVCSAANLGLPVNGLKQGSSDLYGVLVARNAYVPISAEVFSIVLKFLD